MHTFRLSVKAGGAESGEAFQAAVSATIALEDAIKACQAAGSPITPATIATMQAYQLELTGAALKSEELAAKTALGAKGINVMSTEATLARGNLGGLARAIASVGGPVAEIVLPLLVLEGLFRLLPQLAKPFEVGMKALGIEFGTTSSEMAAAVVELGKVQAKFEEVDPAARKLADGLDLVNEAGTTVQQVANAEDAALGGMIVNFGRAATVAHDFGDKVKVDLDAVNEALNKIRVTSPGLAAQMTKDFQEILQQASENVPGAVFKLNEMTVAYVKAGQQAQDSVDAITKAHKDLGKTAETDLVKFTQGLQQAAAAELQMRNAGLTDEEVWTRMKAKYAALSEGLTIFRNELSHLGDAEQAEIVHVKEMISTYGGVQQEIDKVNKAHDAEIAKADRVVEAWDNLAKKTVESIEKMRAKRDEDIAKIDQQTNKVLTSIATEEDALRRQYLDGVIDQQAYRRQMDALILAGVNADATATAEKLKLNEAEKKSEAEKVQDFQTKSAEYALRLTALNTDYDAAKAHLDLMHAGQTKVTEQMTAQLAAMLASAEPAKTMAGVMKDNAAAQKEMHTNLVAANKQIAAAAKVHAAAAKGAVSHAKAARALRVK